MPQFKRRVNTFNPTYTLDVSGRMNGTIIMQGGALVALSNHTHAESDTTSGTLPVPRGRTEVNEFNW
jgi:hypothetical protein